MKVWIGQRLRKGIFGKGNSTREDAKLGIKGHRRISQRFLQGCIEEEMPAQRLAMGAGASVKRQNGEKNEMARPAQETASGK